VVRRPRACKARGRVDGELTVKVAVNAHTDRFRALRIPSNLKQTLVIKPRSSRGNRSVYEQYIVYNPNAVYENMCKENGNWGMTAAARYHRFLQADVGLPLVSVA
jgi:hypothetical protein